VRNVILAQRTTLQGQPLLYPASGPFYPTEFASAQGLSGPIELYYRPFALGPAIDDVRTEAQHLVAGAKGLVAGWNYDVAFVYSQNTVKNSGSGMVSARRLMDAMSTGLVNPFGPSGPEGEALLAGTAWSESFSRQAITSSVEGQGIEEIYRLPAGALALRSGRRSASRGARHRVFGGGDVRGHSESPAVQIDDRQPDGAMLYSPSSTCQSCEDSKRN
jgi:iron complex outermembrane receptor protein